MSTSLGGRWSDRPWARSPDGIFLGVCKGLADRFQVDVMLVRIIWFCSVFFWGTGLLLYVALAVSFPKTTSLADAFDGKIFGVCGRFSRRFDIDVGLVRAGAILSLFLSGGATFLVYCGLYFVLPTHEEMQK